MPATITMDFTFAALVFTMLATAGPLAAAEQAEKPPGTPKVLWTVDTNSDSKGSAAIADIDGDGKLDIVFGTYFNDRHVYAVSAVDGKVKWKFLSDRGPLDASVAIVDLDKDGKPEILAADSSSGNLFCLNGQGKELWRLKLPNSTDSPPAIADLDGDGKLEIVVGSMWMGDGKGHVGVYRAADRKLVWQKKVPGCVQSAPCLVDLDGDNVLDVIVTSWRGDRGVHAFSGKDGKDLWTFLTAGTDRSVGMYHGPSISGGGAKRRIIVATGNGDVYALDNAGKQVWRKTLAGEYLFGPTTVADVNGDGNDDVLVSGRRNLYAYRADDGTLLWKHAVTRPIARGAVVADTNGDGSLNVIFCEGTRLHVIDGKQGKPLMTFDAGNKQKRVTYEKISSAPVVADFDGDGTLDVFFIVGRGVYGRGGTLMKDNYGRGYALQLGGKGAGWTTFRGNLSRDGRAAR